jgi:hypothetical protein
MEREDILDDLPELKEIGLHKKHDLNGEKAIQDAERAIKKNPIEDFLKKARYRESDIQKDVNKSKDWLEDNFKALMGYLNDEIGVEEIQLRTFFIRIPREIHNCYKIDFPFENIALGYHEHGNKFAFHMSSTLENIDSIYDRDFLLLQEQFVEAFYKEFMRIIPRHQLKAIYQLIPDFFSANGIDPEPRFNMEIEVNRKKAYGSLFLDRREELPLYLFMPIYASMKDEIPIVITPNPLYDVRPLIRQIAERINVDFEKISNYRYVDLVLDFAEIKNATALRAARKIRTTYERVDLRAAKEFLKMNYEDLSATENTSMINRSKGEEYQELYRKILVLMRKQYESMNSGTLSDPLFGPREERVPIDKDLKNRMVERFKKDKKAILKAEGKR